MKLSMHFIACLLGLYFASGCYTVEDSDSDKGIKTSGDTDTDSDSDADGFQDDYVAQFPLLKGNDFVFEVDRISDRPQVVFPHDELQESHYSQTTNGRKYSVHFSDNGEDVTIDWLEGQTPGYEHFLGAEKISDVEDLKNYEIQEGSFAGGRFNVWITDSRFEAELTIFGSGVPIISSERGDLLLKKER